MKLKEAFAYRLYGAYLRALERNRLYPTSVYMTLLFMAGVIGFPFIAISWFLSLIIWGKHIPQGLEYTPFIIMLIAIAVSFLLASLNGGAKTIIIRYDADTMTNRDQAKKVAGAFGVKLFLTGMAFLVLLIVYSIVIVFP